MPRKPRLTRDEILERYSDVAIRRRVTDLLDLRSFLIQCIIAGNYKISDDLNSAISLTDYGQDTLRELTRKQIPAKEARLICFLEFFHLDLLVEPMDIDPEVLALSIGKEITEGRIQLPFVHGPELYDRAAKLFKDERSYLDTGDTQRLLEGTPTGVFQMGTWISGPRGILRSEQSRFIRPTLIVPLQHCHDVSCRQVHRIQLTTDYTADVNDHRSTATKVLRSQSEEPSEFPEFFSEISKNLKETYDDRNTGSLAYLIGGALSDEELRVLLRRLLDDTGGKLRNILEPYGMQGSSADWSEGCRRDDLLQQILLLKDQLLVQTIDRLVFADKSGLDIPSGEVRTSLLFGNTATGAFAARAQLSSAGLRFHGARDLAPLRLRRLVDDVFREEGTGETDIRSLEQAAELGWQLRGIPGENVTSKLDEYLRTEEPSPVLERLILSRRGRVLAAARRLQLDIDESIDDRVLLERLLWKLGFDSHSEEGIYGRFAEDHARISQMARSARVSTVVDWEAIRGVAANYFVALEGLLHDSVAFATWILTTDHAAARYPFQYNPDWEQAEALLKLTAYEAARPESGHPPLTFNEKSTLEPLCAGFRVLADLLESALSNPMEYKRVISDYPEYHGNTQLQIFPFEHTMLYLDLTESAQSSILTQLRNASRLLSGVPAVRNEQLHHRPSNADLDRFHGCLADILTALDGLESAGFVRSLFRLDRHESDRWGRKTFYFRNSSGREVALPWPTPYAWLNLPDFKTPQYLVTSAQFAEPREVIRVRPAYTSGFAKMWKGFPQRSRRTGRESYGHESQELSGQQDSQPLAD